MMPGVSLPGRESDYLAEPERRPQVDLPETPTHPLDIMICLEIEGDSVANDLLSCRRTQWGEHPCGHPGGSRTAPPRATAQGHASVTFAARPCGRPGAPGGPA